MNWNLPPRPCPRCNNADRVYKCGLFVYDCSACGKMFNWEPRTDGELLAASVIQGETEAAYALADEVQMSLACEGYVTRNELITALHSVCTYLTVIRRNSELAQVVNEMIFDRLKKTGEDPR